MIVVQRNSLGEICPEGNSGCGLEGSLGAVQWKATDLEGNIGCGPVGKEHCKSLGVVWRGSVLAVHWVSSGGNQWVWSSGHGPVGVVQ